MRFSLFLIIGIGLFFSSCQNEAKPDNARVDSSVADTTSVIVDDSNWGLVKRFRFENARPYGIANFKHYLAISDPSENRVVLFDTLDYSILVDLDIDEPGLIKVKKSTLVVPSLATDSVYYFKGYGIRNLSNFEPMVDPSGVDVERVDHWAFVDQGNNRVLFQNAPKGIQHIFGEQSSSEFKLKDPTNVLLLDTLICVVDTGNKRVQVYTESGNFYSSISNNNSWINPTGISNEEDTLYISDPAANRIDLFTVQGEYLETIFTHLSGPTDLNYYESKLFIANNEDSTITVLKEMD